MTIVAYVLRLVEDGLTLAAVRRVLELEDRVRELEAERDALAAALDRREELIARLRPFMAKQSSEGPAETG